MAFSATSLEKNPMVANTKFLIKMNDFYSFLARSQKELLQSSKSESFELITNTDDYGAMKKKLLTLMDHNHLNSIYNKEQKEQLRKQVNNLCKQLDQLTPCKSEELLKIELRRRRMLGIVFNAIANPNPITLKELNKVSHCEKRKNVAVALCIAAIATILAGIFCGHFFNPLIVPAGFVAGIGLLFLAHKASGKDYKLTNGKIKDIIAPVTNHEKKL